MSKSLLQIQFLMQICSGVIKNTTYFLNHHHTYTWSGLLVKFIGLEEAQAGIKIPGRNINNLTYADDTTLMAESEEEIKGLLMKMKEESEKVDLKLNIQNH